MFIAGWFIIAKKCKQAKCPSAYEYIKSGTGIPHFPNVCVMPLCFYEKPTLLPVFANGKKYK